jgi:hypothetical protein
MGFSLAFLKKLNTKVDQIKDSTESNIFDAPIGKCKVLKIYVNPNTGKLEIEYDSTPVS